MRVQSDRYTKPVFRFFSDFIDGFRFRFFARTAPAYFLVVSLKIILLSDCGFPYIQ